MKNAKQRNGSVLMEYVIVLVFIGATLALATTQLFYGYVPENPGADLREDPPGFGELGKRFVGFYQRTMGGLSLPVP